MLRMIPWTYIVAVPILSISNALADLSTEVLLLWIIPATIIAFIAERYYE